MAQKILSSLKSILSEAQRRGLVAQNVAQPVKIRARGRDDRKLTVGRDIPTKENAILKAAEGRWRPFLITAVFTGMRASELRGLRWEHVDFEAKTIRITQRADQWGVIGSPKSQAGHREIPMSPAVLNTLKEWRLACPRLGAVWMGNICEDEGRLELVFPNGLGKVENHANIINRGLSPIQIAAGCSAPDPAAKDENGNPVMRAKYGLHSLRHFFASLMIEQGFSAKRLQGFMGHSSIQMTFDRYGHLFPSAEDDHAKFAAGELAVVK